MRTLYIADLDGTLLNPQAVLSAKTAAILRERVEAGMAFTVATARTAATVLPLLREVPLRLPVILMNGVLIYDVPRGLYTQVQTIESAVCRAVFRLLHEQGITGFAYTVEDNRMHTFYENLDAPHRRAFYEERRQRYHKEFTHVPAFEALIGRPVVYLSLFDREELLRPVWEALAALPVHCEFYRDIYSPSLWYLELSSPLAAKSCAALRLKKEGGFDRLVSFGDNRNDLSLFSVSDEAYAVANARPEVKAAATAVIGGNGKDGVAIWLRDNT